MSKRKKEAEKKHKAGKEKTAPDNNQLNPGEQTIGVVPRKPQEKEREK